MRSVKKWIIGIIGSFIVIVVCAWIALEFIGGLFGPVEETVLLRQQNVSRQLEYVLIERNGGGATVDFSYSVRLRPVGSEERGEEVLHVYRVDPEDIMVMWRGNELSIGLRGNVSFMIRRYAVTVAGQEVKVNYDSLWSKAKSRN